MLLLSAVLAATLTGASIPPAGPDGSELLRACTATVREADGAKLNPEDAVRSMYCLGYVSGFLDGLAILSWNGGQTKVCLPEKGIENEQAVRILVKYLRDHPEQLHQSGRLSLIVAIGEAFKC